MTNGIDDFDHDEPTNVEHSKETADLQADLDRVELVELTKRMTMMEKHLDHFGELLRQVIDRLENIENPPKP